MILSEQQHDSLTELVQIAFSRAAAALSELTQHRVTLDRPQVSIHPLTELTAVVGRAMGVEVATVHQVFSGPVAGDAFLLLDQGGAAALAGLLAGGPESGGVPAGSAEDVLTETGNILLNACLGMFGNLLQIHVSFSVPRLRVESLHALVDSLLVGREELRYALLVVTRFRVKGSEVSGYLMIALGVTSLDRLIQAVETLG